MTTKDSQKENKKATKYKVSLLFGRQVGLVDDLYRQLMKVNYNTTNEHSTYLYIHSMVKMVKENYY